MRSSWLLAVLVGCGGGAKPSTPETPAVAHNATPEASATPPLSCQPAAFAIDGCAGGGRCIGLYEVDATCVVRLKKEVSVSTIADEVHDIAWPKRDGSLYVVASREGAKTWQWTEIASPLTVTDGALEKLKWHGETLGDQEPEGFEFGLAVDGDKAILTSCAKWDESNEEEWGCKKPIYVALDTKKPVGTPAPVYAEPFAKTATFGKVTLREGKKKSLECGVDGTPPELSMYGAPRAIAPFGNDAYILVDYHPGHRMTPHASYTAKVMRGCKELEALAGDVVLGPSGFLLRQPSSYNAGNERGWKVFRAPGETALLGENGKPFRIEAEHVGWAK